MYPWSKGWRAVILLLTIVVTFTAAKPTPLLPRQSTALVPRQSWEPICPTCPANPGTKTALLSELAKIIEDILKDDNAYDGYDDTCVLHTSTLRGGGCEARVVCYPGGESTEYKNWPGCYLGERNSFSHKELGDFWITYTQAGGVNGNTQDGLHHPVIEVQGYNDKLDVQSGAAKVGDKLDDGGNICEYNFAGGPGLSWKCGFPKRGKSSFFGMSLIPDDDPAPGFTPGWCTAHVNQYQRNQLRTGSRYRFDVIIYDAAGKQISHTQREEVDENGVIQMTSRLPYVLILRSGKSDEDFVSFDYAGQSWSCDNNDGGGHYCTLGNGPEHGYENGDREGDFGFRCDAAPSEPPPPPPPPPPPAKKKGKFMIAGDSISHGMEADFTWRWRLHNWLHSNGHDIDFVGPFTGTHGTSPVSAVYPSPPLFAGETKPEIPRSPGSYASSVPGSFTAKGHASWWGRQAAQTRHTIKDWVATYQPDYLLLLLGFNDLGWWVSGPEGLVGNMGNIVAAARAGKPDINIIIGNVVDRTFIGGRQDLVDNTARYNQLLRTTMPQWGRLGAGLGYVDVNSLYNCRPGGCPDGYDGLHPNAMGEYHIAQAFARNLKEKWGFTGSDFSVPAAIEPRVVNTPTNIRCSSRPEGNFVEWNRDPQARGYEIRSRLQGMSDWWSTGSVVTPASFSSWVLEGQTWEYQVRTKSDNGAGSAWSGPVFCTAHPKTAPSPKNITAAPSGNGIQINWTPVPGHNVNRYAVTVWDKDVEGSYIQIKASGCCGFHYDGLVPGHRYGTWVTTYVNMVSSWTGGATIAGGLPGAGREVIVGGGVPGPVGGLRIVNTDPTTVMISWNAGSGWSTGYAIYVRSIRPGAETAQRVDGRTTTTSFGVAYLFPGTWNYEFCVAAYNGNLESSESCIIPPKYPGWKKRYLDDGNSTMQIANQTVTLANNMELREMFHEIHHNETAQTMGVAPGAVVI